MNRIVEFASILRLAMAGVVIMVTLSTIAIVIFGCRTSLATHRESIEIMHLIGAEDSMIARAFMDRYLIHGLFGGIGGMLLASGLLLLLGSVAADIGQGLISSALPDTSIIFWLLLMPFIAGTVTMFTAFFTVRRALSHML
jgi:cell division transport system permease protein